MKRVKESGLPPRMYARDGKLRRTYFMVTKESRYLTLGRNLDRALDQYHEQIALENDQKGVPSIDLQTEAKRMFLLARKGAKVRKIDFSITVDDVEMALRQSRGFCQVTKSPFSPRAVEGKRFRPFAPSIDRIDSAKGYVPGNIRVVTTMVNLAINQFGDAALLTMLSGYMRTLIENAS